MRKSLFLGVLMLLGIWEVWGQTDYLNSRFALISTDYKMHCNKCREISNSLFDQMKIETLFNMSDQYPNWIAAKVGDRLSRNYRGINFFLVSTMKQEAQGYKISFSLYDTDGTVYTTKKFVQEISADQPQVDAKKVAKIIIEELNFFKSNGQFKTILLVDDFEINSSEDDMSVFKVKFSDWLAKELSRDDVISLKYHVYYYKEFGESHVENKLDGDFYPQSNSKLKMKINIELLGDQETSKTLKIDIIEYENQNRNEILQTILDTINEIEKRN